MFYCHSGATERSEGAIESKDFGKFCDNPHKIMPKPVTCNNCSKLIQRIPKKSYISELRVYELNNPNAFHHRILIKRDIHNSQGHYRVNYAESDRPITIRLGPEREAPKNPELDWKTNTLCNVLDFMISD